MWHDPTNPPIQPPMHLPMFLGLECGCVKCLCTHTHIHACMHRSMYRCTCSAKRCTLRNYKWPHLACLTCVCVHVCEHVCMHACMQVLGCPTHPQPIIPTNSSDPRGCQIIKNAISLEVIEIIWFCLKIYKLETPPLMGGYMSWWVAGWMVRLMGVVISNH